MDSTEVDALVAASNLQSPAVLPAADITPIIDVLQARLGGSLSAWDKAFEATIMYGPGGKTIPTGPYLGISGFVELMAYFTASPLTVGTTFKTIGVGTDQKVLFLGCDISGTTPSTGQPFASQMTLEVQFKNGVLFKEVQMLRFALDPALID